MSVKALTIHLPGVAISISLERRAARNEHTLSSNIALDPNWRTAHRHPDAVLEATVGIPMRR